ncbi:MAG: radical SAM protein [Methylococcales bacterium]|nr:radical SAM protein [Methylococcales bacterium]
MKQKLSITDHSRDIAGLKYIYPVISRRAGGLSIGINVNINNACNWRCVYCQVPGLIRGAAPDIDLQLLERELRFFLKQVLGGHFFDQFNVPEELQVIKDIAISGNGEPTSLKQFDKVIELIGEVASEMGVFPESHFVLITNGSLINQPNVQAGIKALNHYQGKVWFKLDSATEHGRKLINDTNQSIEKTLNNLKVSVNLCETIIQTCILDYLDKEDAQAERKAYIELLMNIKKQKLLLKKVMLYTLARPSFQPEADKIKKINAEELKQFAGQIRDLGYFEVSVSL